MKSIKEKFDLSEIDHISFATIGLACHALCLIEKAGILELLKNKQKMQQSILQNYCNPHLIRAALVTLVGAKVLSLTNDVYCLTELGESLVHNMGTITLPFVGYRKLLAKQLELLQNPVGWKDAEIDYSAIALSSIEFGLHDLDPLIIDTFRALNPKGTVCDLGCGTGEKLLKICKSLRISGLGIEKNRKVIQESKRFITPESSVQIIHGDVFNLRGVWEDIDVAMISFVYHDIATATQCVDFLKSIHTHFPRLRCLVVVDIVSFSEGLPYIMPGFDYVHGLQGITPRNYNETLDTFAEANFSLFKEISVPHMPNTFIWVIKKNIETI